MEQVMIDGYEVKLDIVGQALSPQKFAEVDLYLKAIDWKELLTATVIRAIEQFPEAVNGNITVRVDSMFADIRGTK